MSTIQRVLPQHRIAELQSKILLHPVSSHQPITTLSLQTILNVSQNNLQVPLRVAMSVTERMSDATTKMIVIEKNTTRSMIVMIRNTTITIVVAAAITGVDQTVKLAIVDDLSVKLQFNKQMIAKLDCQRL
jgi:hypothetical protein